MGKHIVLVDGLEVEVFTMTLGEETIELLPHRNWSQLDIYKWRARGKLPGTPAGLEIAPDHVKVSGESVSPKEPGGCAHLERLLEEWLTIERQGLELARRKAQMKAARPAEQTSTAEEGHRRFEVEVDKEGIVHVNCLRGKERLATIGLNPAGFQSLVSQGLLRKPHSLKTGALHDWVEVDGVLFSFEKGNNDSARLTQTLNESYLPLSSLGHGKDIVVFANAASSTGFDIQFPAKVGGVPDNRRRPLDEAALDLLQDPNRCGLLQNGLVIKLTRPTLIFKQKTADGGERYLESGAATLVKVVDEDGAEKLIDVSHPVNYLHLTAVELTGVFNHPTVNRHSQSSAAPTGTSRPANAPATPAAVPIRTAPAPAAPGVVRVPSDGAIGKDSGRTVTAAPAPTAKPPPVAAPVAASKPVSAPIAPNLWLKPILAQQSIRYDWFTCLAYSKIAGRVGNSKEVELRGERAWLIRLGESSDPADPACKGIFLTEAGGFGYLGGGQILRFENHAVQIGADWRAEPVRLIAVGTDGAGEFVFVTSEDWRPNAAGASGDLSAALTQLRGSGAVLMSAREVLGSSMVLETAWTVPVEQSNPAEPQAVEHVRKREQGPAIGS